MRIAIGEGSCGVAAGAGKVHAAIEQLRTAEDTFELSSVGCIGMCYLEPIVDLYEGDELQARLVRVSDQDAAAVVEAARTGNLDAVADLVITDDDAEFLTKQTRIALRHCGLIDPMSLEAYQAVGGYSALRKVLTTMTPEDVIEEIKVSGLAGRGGAGFPTWFKWDAARKAQAATGQKFLVCNADEGDPGAFMDRALLESDPHSVLEGMLIGAYAIGATQMLAYVRAEYPLAIKHLQHAIDEARAANLLGDNIMGTDFSCDFAIKQGAGAFVCGEETALIESMEGKRGMPRCKPPFPAQCGYLNEPSNINNVETFGNVTWIINHGGAAYAAMGTENSKGTKVFALTGKIRRGGLVEIPMGATLHDVIYDIGGGLKGGAELKAVQLGGPSGGCVPAHLMDTVIDYKALGATGAIMGSGGMVVMDTSTCMVGMAKFFLDFTASESCGKCVPCRLGTQRMQEVLTRIVEGEGKEGDVELLEELCQMVGSASLCGLGQTAPNPVLTTIRYFRNEYDEHIRNKKCPAHECPALRTYSIDPEKCTGCTLCARKCAVGAITGEKKQPHVIDPTICIRCNACAEACRFGAVVVE